MITQSNEVYYMTCDICGSTDGWFFVENDIPPGWNIMYTNINRHDIEIPDDRDPERGHTVPYVKMSRYTLICPKCNEHITEAATLIKYHFINNKLFNR